MGALESLNKDGEVWPDREASSFSIQYCVNPRLKQCHCGGTDVGGVVTPCQTHGGKFRKGEMMVCYGDGLQTFCHVTCVSHDLANGYMLEGVDDEYESAGKDGDDPGLGGYLQGMDDLEPSHAEWATAYLKAMRYGENAKAATLLESVPKPRREPAKKRPEAAADAPAGFPAKKPKAAPKEPKPPAGPLRPLKASISGKRDIVTENSARQT
ncbi:hypothetical protein FOA52_005368 [Chlamydomonas sp. UWO 241]|nr:hypothetical protein FOA52_005368 [Chlamydomonas sp. UWO 241]